MADQLGHYKILDRIGGGTVEVYRARDMSVGRTVALKVLPAEIEPEVRERFLQEAERAARLSHPNIAILYEVGDDEGLFLAYEFVAGETLTGLIADGPLNSRRAIDLSTQIADALADAHAIGVAHGDLTTDRVAVNQRGSVKVLDFALTEWTEQGRAEPSRSKGDHRADIAALGDILVRLLTGSQPRSGPGSSAVLRTSPRELGQIAEKARSGRYETAAAMAAELRAVGARLADRLSAALPATPPPPTTRSTARRVGLFVVLGALASLAWWMFMR